MNVLSLFDGMSCGQIALNDMGLKVSKYYASELDKFAIIESKENWPNMIHLGDVTKWREWDIDWKSIDLLIGGSPCQGFSFAGKQLAFDDPRSALFFVYVDILNHIKSVNPQVKFMLENVKMKKEYLQVITDKLGVEPVFINSALVSAQNRQRFYWCNWEVEQPEDRGIVLADILECDFDMVAATVGDSKNRTVKATGQKAGCLTANYFKGVMAAGRPFVATDNYIGEKLDTKNQINAAAMVDRKKYFLSMTPRGNNKGGLRALDGKTPSITACSWQHNFKLTDGMKYRKLTVIECCRLQGVPDDYFKVSSNTQAYKMLGNGWQVDTIKHIFSTMGEIKKEVQLDLAI